MKKIKMRVGLSAAFGLVLKHVYRYVLLQLRLV